MLKFLVLLNPPSNSRIPTDKKKDLKSGYGGKFFEKQQAVLNRTYEYVLKMRAIAKRGPFAKSIGKQKAGLIPFQVGIAQTSRGIRMLFEDLRERYPMLQYILTSRLNQDILENFFRDASIYDVQSASISNFYEQILRAEGKGIKIYLGRHLWSFVAASEDLVVPTGT